MSLEFYCPTCLNNFETDKFIDNPFFLADKVANCPTCNGKCWETKALDTPLREVCEMRDKIDTLTARLAKCEKALNEGVKLIKDDFLTCGNNECVCRKGFGLCCQCKEAANAYLDRAACLKDKSEKEGPR